MKKLIAILLAVCLVFALTPAAFAADAEEITAANVLNALGLFIGTGTDAEGKPIYDLDRAPNRMEAVTMLVRLLGKEEEANAGAWEIPFTDVKDWAKPYVGYAYANGLTKGYSEKTFGGTDAVTATQYLTFVLRALGYSSDSDFKWNAAWELTDQLGITAGEYDASTAAFDRGDVVKISYAALGVFVKGTGGTLGEKLLDEGVFTVQQYLDAMAAAGYGEEEEGQNPVMNWAGNYGCPEADGARAVIECGEGNEAIIHITWRNSGGEYAQWVIVGELDLDTLTVSYTDCIKTNVTYNADGMITDEVTEYENGTGTIVFDQGTSFTWHEDQSENGRDLTFEWAETVPPEEEDGQNPVMNWIGKYVYGRATATVTCEGTDSARIEIDWRTSNAEHAIWEIVGKLDLDTLTVSYTGAVKKNQVWDENGLVSEDVIYEDGTGTIRFSEGTSFTWHEDQSEYGDEDFTFEWVEIVPPAEEDGQNPVMNFIGEYQCDRAHAVVECEGTDSARIKIDWGGSAWEHAEWVIVGKFDLDTRSIAYSGCTKKNLMCDENGEIAKEEVVYTEGTGTVVFNEDGTFTWHEDQSETGEDVVLAIVPEG